MATKVDKPEARSQAQQAADDLAVLHPERTLEIGGREVTVREYGFVEGLRLRPLAKPLADAIYDGLNTRREVPFEQVLDVMAEHYDAIMQLVAVAADVDQAFIDALGHDDGELLLMTWWGANGPFYVRSAMNRIHMEAQEALAKRRAREQLHDGETSTPLSSPTDTTRSALASTPSGNSSSTPTPASGGNVASDTTD